MTSVFLTKSVGMLRRILGINLLEHRIGQVASRIERTERVILERIGGLGRSIEGISEAQARGEAQARVEADEPVRRRAVMPAESYPPLSSHHLQHAMLFANRTDMIRSLDFLKEGKKIAEVGVLQGNFSEILLDALNPSEFVALDLFDIHLSSDPWAKTMAEPFDGKTHLEFYRDRFKGKNVRIVQGDSCAGLLSFPDAYFDMIYIDGDHTYSGVKRDTEAALLKIKPDGVLIFNDYILYDWNVQDFYGIVPVVNDLVVNHGFEVLAFAFERTMFCDIALRRRSSQPTLLPEASPHANVHPESDLDYNTPFDAWAAGTNIITKVPNHLGSLATSWGVHSKYGSIINEAMMAAEYEFAKDLLLEVKQGTRGAICEFGVFEGKWIKKLSDICEEIELKRPIYGFDSFEGLPSPQHGLDIPGFERGQYAAAYDQVFTSLDCANRDITLVKGWFSDSLKNKPALDIDEIAYARIDCDLYEPALHCLEYLQSRLTDGAILVFDDWSWWFGQGEARSFFEWAGGSGLKFEFLAFNSWIHLYLRVRRLG